VLQRFLDDHAQKCRRNQKMNRDVRQGAHGLVFSNIRRRNKPIFSAASGIRAATGTVFAREAHSADAVVRLTCQVLAERTISTIASLAHP
jgi:hypothetical protein